MSKLLLVAAVTALVERDATTTLPVTVAAHELEVVKAVFGEENVTGETPAGETVINLAEEPGRLERRYGADAVIATFGANFKGAITKAVTEHSKGEVDEDGKPVKSAKAIKTATPE